MQNDRTVNLEELMLQLSNAKGIRSGFEGLGLDVPENVQERVESLENRIKRVVRGELKGKLVELEARAEALKPSDVKLAETVAQIAALKAKLS